MLLFGDSPSIKITSRFAKLAISAALLSCTGEVNEGKAIGCGEGPACGPGEICLADGCRRLCQQSSECAADETCGSGVCVPDLGFPPTIDTIDGTGSRDLTDGHTTHHLRDRLIINGTNLRGARVTLVLGEQTWDLESCEPETNERLAVALPADIDAGTYSLTVANQAGACSANLSLLQGEPGAVDISDLSGRDIINYINDSTGADPTLVIDGTLHGMVSSVAIVSHPTLASARSLIVNGAELVANENPGVYIAVFDLTTHGRVGFVAAESVEASYDPSAASDRTRLLAILSNLSASHVVFVASTGDVSALSADPDLVAALKGLGASRAVEALAASEAYAFIGAPGLGEGNGLEQLGNSAQGGVAAMSTLVIDGGVVGFRRNDIVGNFAASATRGGAAVDVDCVGCVEAGALADGSVDLGDLAGSGCSPGQVIKRTTNGWECAADSDVPYTGGTGITIDGSNNIAAALGTSIATAELDDDAVTAAKVQFNWAASASEGGAASDVTCATAGCVSDADIAGLAWSKLTSVPAGFADGVDDDTTYGAGTGISIDAGNNISSALGTSISTAELDNDAVTAAKVQFNWAASASEGGAASDVTCATAGCVADNDIAGLAWSKLTSVPAGFADGVDNNTTYGAGTGISIDAGNNISAALGTSISTAELDNDAVTAAKVQFNWAASASEGGAASDVTCATAGCVADTDIAGLAWSKLTSVPAGFADGVDNNTTYGAGTGISIDAGNNIAAALGTSISTAELDNDAVTAAKVQFNWAASASEGGAASDVTCATAGCVADADIAGLAWSKLTSVPAGFADGVDNNTTYGAGAGISIDGSNNITATLGATVGTAELEDGSVTSAKLSSELNLRGANLIPNPYFTSQTAGLPSQWTFSYASSGSVQPATLQDVSATSTTGPWAIQNGGATRVTMVSSNYIPIDQRFDYVVEAVFRDVGGGGSIGKVIFGVQLFDRNNVQITSGTESTWWLEVANVTPGSSWTRYAGTFGAGTASAFPASARSVKIAVMLNKDAAVGGNMNFQVQGLRLIEDSDADTVYSAGTGITITSGAIAATLGTSIATGEIDNDAVTAAKVQFNYAASASEGGAASDVACATAGCVADADIATVSWSKLTTVPAGFADGVDHNTTYGAGVGISIDASNNISAALGLSIGTAEIENDAVTSTKVQFNWAASASEGGAASDLACATSPCVADGEIGGLSWSKLTSVPAGFADGVDDGQSYSAGTGISINASNVVSASLGTSIGTAEIETDAVTAAKVQFNYAASASEGGAASDVSCSGCVEDGDITSLAWTKLTGIPAGFNDGIDNDNDTTYSAGTGITITGATNAIAATLGTSIATGEIDNDAVTAAKVQFNWAASASEGGAASDVSCTGCVDNSDINTVSYTKISGSRNSLYSIAAGCSLPGGATTASTCSTICCSVDYWGTCNGYKNCAGTCSLGSPTSCSNTFLGYLY